MEHRVTPVIERKQMHLTLLANVPVRMALWSAGSVEGLGRGAWIQGKQMAGPETLLPERLLGDTRTGEMEGVRDEE